MNGMSIKTDSIETAIMLRFAQKRVSYGPGAEVQWTNFSMQQSNNFELFEYAPIKLCRRNTLPQGLKQSCVLADCIALFWILARKVSCEPVGHQVLCWLQGVNIWGSPDSYKAAT